MATLGFQLSNCYCIKKTPLIDENKPITEMKVEHTFEQNRFRILILSSDVRNVVPLFDIAELKSLWIDSSSIGHHT